MEKYTTMTLDEQIKLANDKLAEIRSAKKEIEQEKALMDAPMNKENRNETKEKFYSDIQNAMKENRTVTVSGTDTVNVASDLVYALEDKDDLLNRFSLHTGASSKNVIPLWNNSIGEFAPVEEDGTFTSSNGTMATVTVEPKAFAKSIKISDEVLKLSAVNFEAEINKILSRSVRRTILKGIFNGVDGRFVGIADGATKVQVSAINVSALQKLALTVLAKNGEDNAILINPMDYATITDENNKKSEILLNQIIETKKVEGVDLILSNYVPQGTVLAGNLSNYGVGVANEMEITPKATVGSLAHTYDCSVYVAGKPIVATDFFVLDVQ